ncbi:unnamed protein product [Gongylonema pulchrum]|uniref:Transposase n=1 Tax=Gongylonema pulchrum TaxID=637853 RepID=A0A183D4U3_9BILA|nr:unnamed protein product [Gongylonema pulchrum]
MDTVSLRQASEYMNYLAGRRRRREQRQNMLGQNTAVTSYQISHYFTERVAARKSHVHKAVHMIAKIVQEILKEVEAQEPRFISTLIENNGRYEGVRTVRPWINTIISWHLRITKPNELENARRAPTQKLLCFPFSNLKFIVNIHPFIACSDKTF